jgi:hypothetical protein
MVRVDATGHAATTIDRAIAYSDLPVQVFVAGATAVQPMAKDVPQPQDDVAFGFFTWK